MDDELKVDKGDTIEGTVIITRNQEWKRHLKVTLDFTVNTKTQGVKVYVTNVLCTHRVYSVSSTPGSDVAHLFAKWNAPKYQWLGAKIRELNLNE